MPAIRIEGVPAPAGQPAGGLPAAALPGDMTNMNMAQLNALSAGAMNTPGAAAVNASLSAHAAGAAAATRAAAAGSSGSGSTPLPSMMGATYIQRPSPNTINASVGSQFTNPGSSSNSIQPNSVLWFLRDIAQTDKQIAASVGASGGRPAFMPPGAVAPPPSWIPPGTFNPWTAAVPGGPVPGIPRPPRQPGPPRPPRPPGGGGGGGGGRGRGPGGTGGGRGGIPFAGVVGLGRTGSLIAGGLGIEMGAEVAEEIAFLPQHLMGMEGAALGSAAPYWDYRQEMAGIAHAGGMDSEDLQHRFYQGVKPPEWMTRLGLGPGQASSLLRNYGIVQTGENSATGNQSVVEELAKMKFIPAFGGLPAGMVEGSAANAANYGAVGSRAGGLREYDAQMVDVLAKATEMGLNRASILRSIDTSIASAARSGGGIGFTPGAVGNALMQYAELPGGRTGEVGRSMIQAGQDFAGQAGKTPLSSIAFASLSQRLDSEGSMKSYFDSKEPGFYDKMKSNPASARLMQDYLAARKDGNTAVATAILGQIVQQSPRLGVDVATEEGAGGSFAPGYMRDFTSSQILGQPMLSTIARDQDKAAGGSGSISLADKQGRIAQMQAAYRQQGFTGAQAAGMIGAGVVESGLNPRAFNPDGGGRGAMGIFQWRGDRITAFEKQFGHSPIDANISSDQLFAEQMQFQKTEMAGSESSAAKAIRSAGSAEGAASATVANYLRPGADAFSEANRASAVANRINTSPDTSGLATNQLETQAMGQAGVMAGAQVSAAEAAQLIPRLNNAIQAMIDGFGRAQTILNQSDYGHLDWSSRMPN